MSAQKSFRGKSKLRDSGGYSEIHVHHYIHVGPPHPGVFLT